MNDPSVLALDLATVTGWATFNSRMDAPAYGAERMRRRKSQELGPGLERLRCLLNEKHKIYRLTHVFIEHQHVASNFSPDTLKLLMGLAAMAEWWCHMAGVQCMTVGIAEWRKHFIGRGGGWYRKDKKTGEGVQVYFPKQMAIERCDRLGWPIEVEDEAEALGILDYVLSLFEDDIRPWRDVDLMAPR